MDFNDVFSVAKLRTWRQQLRNQNRKNQKRNWGRTWGVGAYLDVESANLRSCKDRLSAKRRARWMAATVGQLPEAMARGGWREG